LTATVFFAGTDELAVLTNTFSVGGTPTDPGTVTLTVTDPTGTQTTPAPTHVSTGKYTATVSCAVVGIWTYTWDGSGAASDIVSGTWTVTTTALNQRYCSVEELKSRLGITDTSDDFEIELAVEAASRSVDEITGRYFWQGTDTRTYVPQNIYGQQLDDIVSVTSFMTDSTGSGVYDQTWTLGTDYQLTVSPQQYNAGAKGEAWPYTGFNILGPKFIPYVWPWSHQNRIQVTGVFGWPAVPLAVKQASLIAAADLFKRKDAFFGVLGSPAVGVVRVGQNPIVLQLLRRYITGSRVGV
jgi:Phage gp6-like head-tail connector protein